MEFMFNELSLHGQFRGMEEAEQALRKLLGWRKQIRSEGTVLRGPRQFWDRPFTTSGTVRDVVKGCKDAELRVSVINWLAKEGPFWDVEPHHGPDDWLECAGQIITNSSIAEAAVAVTRGHEREILSVSPSSWERTPLTVDWVHTAEDREAISLGNVWHDAELARLFKSLRRPLASWGDLVEWTRQSCPRLTLGQDVIAPLARHPFVPGAARRFQELLLTLDKVKGSFGTDGKFDGVGMRLLQDHFVGDKAWFSDSSDSDKSDFRSEMTFHHPMLAGQRIFCPWHGKVKIQQMRVHFSYPITSSHPLFIVYIGPKITKR